MSSSIERIDISKSNILIFQSNDVCDNVHHPPKIVAKHHSARVSKPIPIGVHHTVCGSEALTLAKRLSEELAHQQAVQGGSLGNQATQHKSPDEPRSRSFEQGEKSKGNFQWAFAIDFNRFPNAINRQSQPHQQQKQQQPVIENELLDQQVIESFVICVEI